MFVLLTVSKALEQVFKKLLTLRCSDTSYTLWRLWASTCLQQQNHIILQLSIACSVTCTLERRLKCLCFWETTLKCIKSAEIHSLRASALPSPASTPQGWSRVYINVSAAAVGWLRSPEWSVLSDIYVWLSSLGPEWDPYVVLAASHLHHLSRCSVPSFVLQSALC